MLRTASLISALPLASPPHQTKATETLALLAYALTNIARETEFFDSLPPRFLVDLEADPSPEERDVRFKTNLGNLQGKMMRPITRAFVDLLISTGAEAGRIDGGMEEGIVLLWAMEKVGAPVLTRSQNNRADNLWDHLAAVQHCLALRRFFVPESGLVPEPVRPENVGRARRADRQLDQRRV